jgi:hypothetical protein
VWLCIHESDKRTVSRRNQIGFLRVALAANAAKKQYRVFTEANVTPEMIAPEIQIYASSQSLGGTAIANVQTIVVLPHNSKDSNRAVHPTRMNEASEEYKNYKNLFGFGGDLSGQVKSGQWWSGQNRPTDVARDVILLAHFLLVRQVRFRAPAPWPAFQDVTVV